MWEEESFFHYYVAVDRRHWKKIFSVCKTENFDALVQIPQKKLLYWRHQTYSTSTLYWMHQTYSTSTLYRRGLSKLMLSEMLTTLKDLRPALPTSPSQ